MSIVRLRTPYAPPIAITRRGGVRTGFDFMVSPDIAARKPAAAPPAYTDSSKLVEKFRDPRADDPDSRCRVSQPYYLLMPGMSVPFPPDPATRITLMRAQVEQAKSSGAIGRGVAPVSDASHEMLSLTARAIYEKYAAVAKGTIDEKQLSDFADSIGEKVDDVVREASSDYFASIAGADIKSLGAEAWKILGPQIMFTVKSIAAKIGSLASSGASASAEFGDAIKAVPVISAVVSAYVDAVNQWSDIRDADWQQWCKDNIDSQIIAPFEKTLKLGYPYPWKAWDLDLSCPMPSSAWDPRKPVSKWDATPAQRNASLTFKTNLRWMLDLERNVEAAAAVSRWWTLAMQLMSVADIRWVFEAFPSSQLSSVCNDGTMSAGESCGWQVASDEQVPLVAFPIAASYGFEPWAFTEELYRRSKGWSDPIFADLLVREPRRQWEYTEDGDIVAKPSICGDSPVNAMQVQWAVLARDAFKLAEDATAGLVPGLHPSVEHILPGSSRLGAIPILGLGGLASGLLYLFGASIGVSLAPVGLSAAYLIVRN